jgi:tetratricopeptide (TPR) repeat protein
VPEVKAALCLANRIGDAVGDPLPAAMWYYWHRHGTAKLVRVRTYSYCPKLVLAHSLGCMSLGAGRHLAVLEELAEWWEDLWQRGIGSQVVFVPVPPGWGRSAVLEEFRAVVEDVSSPVSFVVRIGGSLPPGRAVQADVLREDLAGAGRRSRVAALLGLDTAAGKVQLGLSVGGLFVSGLAAAASVLVASLAVTAAGNAWDGSPAGKEGAVARAARAVAAVSVSVPVVVIIDDADCLEPDLAVTLIRNLAGRYDGQVLVVAAAAPASDLVKVLASDAGYELVGRVHRADADPGMGYRARADLAAELLPELSAAACERIARRTLTFKEVFAVAAAPRLAEVTQDTEAAAAVAMVDAIADAVLERARPSASAIVLAWAGGALHASQLDRALEVMKTVQHQEPDLRITRTGSLIRLAGQADARLAEQVAALPAAIRYKLAGALLGGAVRLAADPEAGLVERVVARQAVHRVRADLHDRSGLAGVQCALIRGLERLGDPAAAREVASAALAELPVGGSDSDRQELLMAMLRLAHAQSGRGDDPLVDEAVALASADGASVGLEARTWAAVDLLSRHRGQPGLALADQVATELDTGRITGAAADQWRLLLAFHAGRTGHPEITQRLLSAMINAGPQAQQDAAQAVLHAVGGNQSDIRLQIIVLEAELSATQGAADDDLLRLHATLAADYRILGEYQQALEHGNRELALRRRSQGDDHPDTLTTRHNIACSTGHCGDAARALRLCQELLPDRVRILGASHPNTLTIRNDIAFWTSECGDAADALRLCQELLPDQVRILGASHPNTLITRNNIASWTGDCGDAAKALRLCQELLPDRVQVLGASHPNTLATRSNIAFWTSECGDAAEALRLCQELLPDQVRILGASHPDTLITRNNIASWTGDCGDAAEALRLFQELLPDRVQVLGASHPDTLITRNNIASWTGKCGDAAEALRLFQELLPDRVQVLGASHPNTLTIRSNIAAWTGKCGDAAEALRLFQELLPDQVRILGASHPNTLITRSNIAKGTEAMPQPASRSQPPGL